MSMYDDDEDPRDVRIAELEAELEAARKAPPAAKEPAEKPSGPPAEVLALYEEAKTIREGGGSSRDFWAKVHQAQALQRQLNEPERPKGIPREKAAQLAAELDPRTMSQEEFWDRIRAAGGDTGDHQMAKPDVF